MVAFMVMVKVDKTQIKRKIRRLLGKAHIGLNYTQQINTLLDHLDKLVGASITCLGITSSLVLAMYCYVLSSERIPDYQFRDDLSGDLTVM